MNQLIATALAEKISALDRVSYLEEKGSKGSREAFLSWLVPTSFCPAVFATLAEGLSQELARAPGNESSEGRSLT